MTIEVYFNPACSKSRRARELLEARGAGAVYRDYLAEPPSRAELERLVRLLGIDDPRKMMRSGEDLYRELAVDAATRDEVLDTLAKHPQLLERPIVVVGERAVIARPPEKLLELIDA